MIVKQRRAGSCALLSSIQDNPEKEFMEIKVQLNPAIPDPRVTEIQL